MLHNSDKEFTLTMGGGCGMLEGGRHGAGVEVQGAGERERSFTDNTPKRTHKNLRTKTRKRSGSNKIKITLL